MKTKEYIDKLAGSLRSLYDDRESKNISNYLVESIIRKRDIRNNPELTEENEIVLNKLAERLLTGEPVQYVTNQTWFYGIKLFADKRVLIPRPETEELTEFIIKSNKISSPVIIDIGTGSGCIAIALKKEIPRAQVYAVDSSPDAIDVAKINANNNNLNISFILTDILSDNIPDLPEADIIVSNPPYVDRADKISMHKNVLDYEPHEALFPEGDDSLIFYKKIAELAWKKLSINGVLYFEIPESSGDEIVFILQRHGYSNVTLRRDIQDKFRFISAVRRATG